MQEYRITVNRDGRFQMPVAMRRALALDQGGELVAQVKDGAFYAVTREQSLKSVVKRAQAFFAKDKTSPSIVDELIADRRQAAKDEYS